MKKNNRKQSNCNPTLSELLEPYLRNPPSPPHPSGQQMPPPVLQVTQPRLLASSHTCTVQKPPAKPWRRFRIPSTQYYRVHPCDFRALVQSLTGASTPSDQDRPSESGERRVQCNQNAAGLEMELSLPPAGKSDLDWCSPPAFNSNSTSDNDMPPGNGECRIQFDHQNAAGVENESTLHNMGTYFWDWCASIVSPRTMGSMAGDQFCYEEDGGM